MLLRTQNFVEKKLERAEYKFDESVREWIGWIRGFPGIYGQGRTIEIVRKELAEMLEEYLFVSFQERKKIQGFDIKIPSYVKTRQPQRAY